MDLLPDVWTVTIKKYLIINIINIQNLQLFFNFFFSNKLLTSKIKINK